MSTAQRLGYLLVACCGTVHATPPLRIGVAESDAAPIVVLNAQRQLASGLSKDLGDALARALSTRASFTVLSRNRVEPALQSGKVDLICNSNPAWFANSSRYGWTRDFYPQIERIVTLKTHPRTINSSDELAALRIGVIRGYHYPTLEPLWQSQRAERANHPHLDSSLKALGLGMADAVVSSELELAAWVKQNPQAGQQLRMQPWVVSVMPTKCAVAPGGKYSVAVLNEGIAQLEKQGELNRILQRYRWKTR
ncbi:MAG: substrate-binding periplasmic protein [Vogesella sp.]|uniref:substrate-binding periplasmic protein n=1 Tax=Vogesella sp. TaxID=1904252 RepID=UPI00391CE2B3